MRPSLKLYTQVWRRDASEVLELREDVRGVDSVVLATPIYFYFSIIDKRPYSHPDIWPSVLRLMVIWTSSHLDYLLAIWTSRLQTSGHLESWTLDF